MKNSPQSESYGRSCMLFTDPVGDDRLNRFLLKSHTCLFSVLGEWGREEGALIVWKFTSLLLGRGLGRAMLPVLGVGGCW